MFLAFHFQIELNIILVINEYFETELQLQIFN